MKSGYSYGQIFNLTLRSYIETLLPKFNPSGCNKYFTYLKNRGRSNKLYGQRYCPECLREDKTPYFRKKWRLKAIVRCEKHDKELNDRCHQCGEPISLYKFNKKGIGFTRCWSCDVKLYNTKK